MISDNLITFAVVGGLGAMGQKVHELCHNLYRTLSIENIDGENLSSTPPTFGNLDAAAKFAGQIDAVIDFSIPQATLDAAHWCAQHRVPFVSGTTGLSANDFQQLSQLSEKTPILHAANFSIGIAALKRLVLAAAQMLPTWDAEVWEAHHRRKIDAPSGTALLLGEQIAHARHQNFDDVANLGRHGHCGPRKPNEIGFQSIRAGNIVGEHTVMFASDIERIELSHTATDRSLFAAGAIDAARWLLHQPPGNYTLDDTLGNAL